MKAKCKLTGEEFEVSDKEIELRRKFGVLDLPEVKPEYRFRELASFWQHWNLHKRTCDRTGKSIISVFREDCEYPVWERGEWIKHADPPSAEIDLNQQIFPQMWELFQKSPIPHTTGAGNENCEYSDDSWFSKNCYLSHSFAHVEDVNYSYRMVKCRDCLYCVFSINLDLCYDTINSYDSFRLIHCLNCRQSRESAFLYDCRNCSDCMFCFNLRNKQYCFGNKQLSKEEFEKKKAEWDLTDREVYEKAKGFFKDMMKSKAWHRALSNDKCENTTGNYNLNCKDSENCYFCQENDECVNCFRNYVGKTSLDFHGQTSEMCFYSILAQDECYDIRFCWQIVRSTYMEYCAFCMNCQNCFGCCGLYGKKFYIFNKPYSEEDYYKLKSKIIENMKSNREYGKFFPSYFVQNPYDESWSGFYFPLTKEEQEKAGFKWRPPAERRKDSYLDLKDAPKTYEDVSNDLYNSVFWDEGYDRPFKVRKEDVQFVKKLGVPIPYTYYMNRILENLKWIPFDGRLRKAKCGECGKDIDTSWPSEYDGRILCEEDYLKVVK